MKILYLESDENWRKKLKSFLEEHFTGAELHIVGLINDPKLYERHMDYDLFIFGDQPKHLKEDARTFAIQIDDMKFSVIVLSDGELIPELICHSKAEFGDGEEFLEEIQGLVA